MMRRFEAQYKALAAGMEPEYVEAAELLVRKAVDISAASLQPLSDVLGAMLAVATVYTDADAKGLATHAADKAEILRLVAELDEAKAEIERLRNALAPFAKAAEYMSAGKACDPEELGVWADESSGQRVTVADFRRAAEAKGK